MRIFIIGYPAAGKSTAGRLLATALGWPFVDLDDQIAARAAQSVAALVQSDLTAFRTLESTLLHELAAMPGPAVIATGAGAATWGENLTMMRTAGCVIALTVAVEQALQRAAHDGPRPLLATADAAHQLWRARASVYRGAHCMVATDDRAVPTVVEHMLAAWRVWQKVALAVTDDVALSPAGMAAAAVVTGATDCVVVGLGERSYPIVVAPTVPWAVLAGCLPQPCSRIAIIYDANLTERVASIEAELRAAWPTAPTLIQFAVPAGEASKSIVEYQRLCDALLAAGLDRQSAILAVGGGVVGDLAGFVAATLLRGIAVVHVPTTLVAMTDSAIGGKTAVDTTAGKNLLGAFWQPRAVLAGLDMLATLPARERSAGFGELWKYAVLDGEGLWHSVAQCAGWAVQGGPAPAVLAEVVLRCAAYKAEVVSADEREQTGRRALLNLGHTVGHAIEAAAQYELSHGESVGLGLLAACRVSTALGLVSATLEPRLAAALASAGLRTDLDDWLTPTILARLAADKKRVGAEITYITTAGPGACAATRISINELVGILRSAS